MMSSRNTRITHQPFRTETSLRRSWLCIVLVLAVCSQGGVAQNSLDAYVSRALNNNPGLRARIARYEAARQLVPQSAALPELRIGAGVFAVPVETRLGPQQAVFSVSQSFPWFGTLGAEEDASAARARQALQEVMDARNRLAYEVGRSWRGLYVLEKSIIRTIEHVALLDVTRSIAVTRYEAGRAPFSDVLRLDMEREELRTRLRSLEDGRGATLADFRRLLNDAALTAVDVPDSLVLRTLPVGGQALRDSLRRRSPRLQALEEAQQFWAAKTDASRRMGYPMLTLGVTYTMIGHRTDMAVPESGRDALLPQVGISIPLFGSRYSAMEEQARLQAEAARLDWGDAANALLADLDQGLTRYRDAVRGIELSERLSGLAYTALDLSLEEYRSGATSLDNVLALQRDLLRHALAREQSVADANTAYDYLMYLTAQE